MAENPDHFFQHRESCNNYYEAVPAIVEEYVNEISKITGSGLHGKRLRDANRVRPAAPLGPALPGAAAGTEDDVSKSGSIRLEPVSYTHLDVYKRPLLQ